MSLFVNKHLINDSTGYDVISFGDLCLKMLGDEVEMHTPQNKMSEAQVIIQSTIF